MHIILFYPLVALAAFVGVVAVSTVNGLLIPNGMGLALLGTLVFTSTFTSLLLMDIALSLRRANNRGFTIGD